MDELVVEGYSALVLLAAYALARWVRVMGVKSEVRVVVIVFGWMEE